MDSNESKREDELPFVFVKSRKRTGQQSRSAARSAPASSELPPEIHADEYAANIHEIHITLTKLRSRISQECGPDFLPALAKVFTDVFTKYLGKLWPEEIVCYALGRFSTPTDWGRSCKLQLILLCELAQKLLVSVSIFDPAFSALEIEYLQSEYCGFSMIDINENGRRIAVRPTFFYMIHADAELYENLVDVNQENSTLTNVVLFGNTFNCDIKPSNSFLNRNSLLTQKRLESTSGSIDDGEIKHVEVDTLPIKDRSGLFYAALTTDTVLHFYLRAHDIVTSNLCTEKGEQPSE